MTMNMAPFTMASMQAGRQVARKPRRPQHPFYLDQRPFEIRPFFIAPVLAGETLKNLRMQARAVTHPLLNGFIGWWLEHYFFYVKLTQLLPNASVGSEMPNMLMNPSWSGLAAAQAGAGNAASTTTFFQPSTNGLNYLVCCRNAIVRHWFRDEEDDYNTYLVNSQPMAQYVHRNVLDSVGLGSELTAADVNVDLNASGTITTSEISQAFQQYQALMMNTTLEMTWEDYLQALGVAQPAVVDDQKPELIRYSRDWQYPSNVVTNAGSPVPAVSWSIQLSADKDRFFKEPGFLVGICVVRPKVYLGRHRGSFTSLMTNYRTWLPPWLMRLPQDSLASCPELSGPLPLTDDTGTGSYYFDIKDLLMYGEQFTNKDLAVSTGMNIMDSPSTDLSNCRYPAAATDINDRLFSSTANSFIRQDGIVSLSILSRDASVDTTPRGGQVMVVP